MLPIGYMKSYQESTNASHSVGNHRPRAVSSFSTETVSARLRGVSDEVARKGVAFSYSLALSLPKYLHVFTVVLANFTISLAVRGFEERRMTACGLGKTQLAVRTTQHMQCTRGC